MVKDLGFDLGDTVYLRTDSEQLKRIVTEISIMGVSMTNYSIKYQLSQGTDASDHYGSEITGSVDTSIKLGL